MVRAAATAEQALGANRVMRLPHEDLVFDPKDALARCPTILGQSYHANCLIPLRGEMDSSRYEDTDDCGVGANLAPFLDTETIELYAKLLGGCHGPVNGGRSERLHHKLREYHISLQPRSTSTFACDDLSFHAQIEQLECERAPPGATVGSRGTHV